MSQLANLLTATAERLRQPTETPLSLAGAIKTAMGKDVYAPLLGMTIPERQLFIGVFRALEASFSTKATFSQWLLWAGTEELALQLIEVSKTVDTRRASI